MRLLSRRQLRELVTLQLPGQTNLALVRTLHRGDHDAHVRLRNHEIPHR